MVLWKGWFRKKKNDVTVTGCTKEKKAEELSDVVHCIPQKDKAWELNELWAVFTSHFNIR